MDWDNLTRWALGAFGFLGLCLMLLTGFFRQLPELIRALQEARQAIQDRDNNST
ncbi:hypothetical protein [Streptomyces sp. BH105]|uniref:hypothetical protein n=1 Tax=Streptomyces sp. BH105 TaxID=3410408 RepID=UPI003CF15B96